MSLMMNIGRTGVIAFQEQVNVGAHNIANSTTSGYKQQVSDLKNLIAIERNNLLTEDAKDHEQGVGVKSTEMHELFTQGTLMQTSTGTNYAVDGEGFFAVLDPTTNELVLTRNGEFSHNEAGELVDYRGNKVMMNTITNEQGEQVEVPALYKPTELAQLEKANNGYYTVANENLISNVNSTEGFGTVRQGFLEGSNVDLAEQMTNLMIAQRAYSMNMKSIQTADETSEIINQLR